MALASPSHPGMLPDPDSCWQAVQRRDRAFNGRFWFSVQTTGVYCLPSCAARPPLRKNVAFHASPEAAEAAGFRPCKRCKPRDWQAELGLSKPVAPRLRAVRCGRRRHAALAGRGGAQGRPDGQHPQQALRRRARRQPARLAGGQEARALPQGPALGREGGRRALRRGLRLAEPRLRDQRQGARHDARDLRQGRRRRAYRLHHGRVRLRPRAGGGDAEGHRRGVPGRQRPHPRARPQARLPGRRHQAQRPGAGAAGQGRAGPALWPQAVGARRARRAARYRRHRLPVEGLEGADRDPARRDPHLWRDRPAHRRARDRPAPSAAPAPPTRRPASFPAIAPSAPAAR